MLCEHKQKKFIRQKESKTININQDMTYGLKGFRIHLRHIKRFNDV